MSKFTNHLKTVMTHRKWVRHYCFKAGMYWQGLTHDLSKYNPTEFLESVKYYQGNRSPIDACKEDKGFSQAWFHHKSHNKHHREFWTDNYDKGTSCIPMPKQYAKEMLCDFLGAGRAYSRERFTYQDEWFWWLNQLNRNICIHPMTAYFITDVLYGLNKYTEDADIILHYLDMFYADAETWWSKREDIYPNTYFGRSLDFKDIIINAITGE